MKFRINKFTIDYLSKRIQGKKDYEEIELEPIWETATEAIKFEEEIIGYSL